MKPTINLIGRKNDRAAIASRVIKVLRQNNMTDEADSFINALGDKGGEDILVIASRYVDIDEG